MSGEDCRYAGPCSGCSYWGIPWETQLRRKIDFFKGLWEEGNLGPLPSIEVVAPADRGLRDRLDFQWREGNFGLFDRTRSKVLDLEECLQLTPALSAWLQDFRKITWPVKKASFRLRVAFTGERGVWLDLSHHDVQELFAEQNLLKDLLSVATVEVGQRRKHLIFDGERLRLKKEPHFLPWTRTWTEEKAVPLYSRIADFSQPGDLANQMLVREVLKLLEPCEAAVDWGCGSGNFTFPLASKTKKVFAFDQDAMSLMGLEKSLEESGWKERVSFASVRFEDPAGNSKILRTAREAAGTWVVDPPRPGVGRLFDELPEVLNRVIVVSCFAESFVQDADRLKRAGFACEYLAMVDQFPQTPHAEWISLWLR